MASRLTNGTARITPGCGAILPPGDDAPCPDADTTPADPPLQHRSSTSTRSPKTHAAASASTPTAPTTPHTSSASSAKSSASASKPSRSSAPSPPGTEPISIGAPLTSEFSGTMINGVPVASARISGGQTVADKGFTAGTSGRGRFPEPGAGELCGPAGPHKILGANCRMEPKSLYWKQLPLRLATGGSVLGRPGAVLCGSA